MGDQVNGSLDVLDGSTDGKGPGVDIDAKEAVGPVDGCLLQFFETHWILAMMDGTVTKEDKDMALMLAALACSMRSRQ